MKRSNRSGPAHRRLPGDRRVRRVIFLLGPGGRRQPAAGARTDAGHRRHRDQDIPLGVDDHEPIRSRPRSLPLDGRDRRTPSATSRQVIGQIVRQTVDGRRRRSPPRRFGGRPAAARSSTSRSRPASAPSRSRSTRSPASARSSRPATTSTWSSASTADEFPVVTTNPADDSFQVVAGLNSTSVKLLLQGMQVLGTLLPPPPAHRPTTPATPRRRARARPCTGQQEIVDPRGRRPAGRSHQVRPDGRQHLAGPALARRLLRSDHGQPLADAAARTTTGIILKTLVDALRRPAAGARRDRPAGAGPALATTSQRGRGRHPDPGATGAMDRPVPRPSRTRATINRQRTRHEEPDRPDGRPDPCPHRRRHPGDPRPPHEAARLRERHRRGRRGRVRDARPSQLAPSSPRTSS